MENISDNSYDRLGEALHAAITSEVSPVVEAPRPTRTRRGRAKLIAGVVVVALAAPAVALAAGVFDSPQEVAQGIPAGTLALMGTEPTCTTVREGHEYDCRLAKAPTGELEPGAWKGTVEPTVDATGHVDGGCRALDGAGTEWRCYLGAEAVRQEIIANSMLGEAAPAPGVG
jgi:hypothetical protein